MEEDGIKELTAHNTTIGVRGIDFVGKYVEALRQASLRYRQDRGDFDT